MPFSNVSAAKGKAPSHDAYVFEGRIEPHDSLGARGFARFVVATLALFCLAEIFALSAGVWVIALFLAIDALLLLGAVKLFRSGLKRTEYVLISKGAVEVVWMRGRTRGGHKLAVFGLNLERDDDPDFGCLGLWLRLRAQRIEIAHDLSPHERAQFGDLLEAALREAGGRPRVYRRARLPLLPLAASEARAG